MAGVVLKGVKKVYDNGFVAVQEFNLDIADKEFVVFVGPSGCGKSTTLRMIAGLEEITEGTISIGDRIVNDVEPKDRDIAMVFQNYALYPHMTVYENMAFALKLRKMDKEVIKEKVLEAAEILGITEYLQKKPRVMSGGQRQRVAIGRAIVRDPAVFLMDEPLSNLDAKLRNQMRSEILLLRKKVDTTFIYVTHDQTEAMTLGDRIVIMKDGFIQQVGTPQQLFDEPANLFVAGFIGAPQMNLIDAQLSKGHISILGKDITLDKALAKKLKDNNAPDGDIVLGIRPEHIQIHESATADSLIGKLQVTEMMGSEYYLHMIVGEDTPVVLRVPTISMSPELRKSLVFDATVHFSFSQTNIHMFSKETHQNLVYPYVVPGATEDEAKSE